MAPFVAPPPSAAARVTRHRRAPYARPIWRSGGDGRIGATPTIPPKNPDERRRAAADVVVVVVVVADGLHDARDATAPSAPTRSRGASADHDARIPTAPVANAARGGDLRHARVVVVPAGATATRARARGVVAAAVAIASRCVAGAPAKAATVARAIRAAFETDLPLMRGRSRAVGSR